MPPEPAIRGAVPERPRLFFALWPQAALAGELAQLAGDLAGACGGRAMHRDNLHLTLAFLGEVDPLRMPEVIEAGRQTQHPAFDFALDRLAWWSHNRIVWAGTSEPGPLAALAELAGRLRRRLVARQLFPDGAKFMPHLTLLRKANRPPQASTLACQRWQAGELVLAASRRSAAGASYERVAGWPLVTEHPAEIGLR